MDNLKPITHREFNEFIKGKGFKGKNNYKLKELKAMFGFKPMVLGSPITISNAGEEPITFDSISKASQCICVNIFKFFNKMAPDYTSEIFHPSHSRHNTRMSTYKLDLPFRKNVHGQKTLSYLGPKTWNSLPAQIKLCKNVNNFKHDIKNLYFKRLQKSDDSIFMYY